MVEFKQADMNTERMRRLADSMKGGGRAEARQNILRQRVGATDAARGILQLPNVFGSVSPAADNRDIGLGDLRRGSTMSALERTAALLGHLEAGIASGSLAAAACGGIEHFDAVPLAAPDSIFGVKQAFKADSSPKKLNLSVGAYRTEEGAPYVLKVVKKVCSSAPCTRTIV